MQRETERGGVGVDEREGTTKRVEEEETVVTFSLGKCFQRTASLTSVIINNYGTATTLLQSTASHVCRPVCVRWQLPERTIMSIHLYIYKYFFEGKISKNGVSNLHSVKRFHQLVLISYHSDICRVHPLMNNNIQLKRKKKENCTYKNQIRKLQPTTLMLRLPRRNDFYGISSNAPAGGCE